MKKSDIFPSNYVKASDIGDREVPVIIADCKIEDIGTDRKLVVYFQGKQKGLVCNRTNFDRIEYICGSGDTDHWTGREIVLYTELATFQGKTAPAIRVKPPAKRQQSPSSVGQGPRHTVTERSGYMLSEMQDPIEQATGVAIEDTF